MCSTPLAAAPGRRRCGGRCSYTADVTDDGSWVRRRVRLAEVPEELVATIDSLVSGCLVVRDGDSVEIVHQVAFRARPRLRVRPEAARSDLVLGRDLRIAARTWTDHGRSDDDVYRGARLSPPLSSGASGTPNR